MQRLWWFGVVMVGAFFFCAGRAGAVTVSASDATLLNGLVATALTRADRVDVLTSTDIKRAIDVEAARSFAGCDTSSDSCMAEIATAMNASDVLHGTFGVLGDDVVLSLTLFDSSRATAVSRVSLSGENVDAVAAQVTAGVAELLSALPPGGARPRVLLLDFAVGATASAAREISPVTWVGAGVAALGAVGVGVALVEEVTALSAANALRAGVTVEAAPAQEAALASAKDIGRIAWIAGAGLLGVGAVVALVPVVGE